MSVQPVEIERRVTAMGTALRDAGLRLTHQRLEVVREIASTDEHPDVEAIYRGVSTRLPTISLDTVYRTLAVLTEQGLVSRVNATVGPARYDANIERHHHFVCTRCGSVRDVADPALDAIRAPEQTATLGVVEAVEVYLKGVCTSCRSNAAST